VRYRRRVRDFVGYGDANDAEGGQRRTGTSNTTDVARAGGGATDPVTTRPMSASVSRIRPEPADLPRRGITGLHIHDIQGAAHLSPYAGKAVADVPGVVTAVGANQLWLQDPSPDDNSGHQRGHRRLHRVEAGRVVGDAITASAPSRNFGRAAPRRPT